MADLIQDESVSKLYRTYITQKGVALSRVSSTVVMLIVPYFIYEDIYVHSLSLASIYLRALPIFFAAVVLACNFSPLRKFQDIIMFFYVLVMISLMIMSAGLVILTVRTPYYEIFVMGLVVVIFAIYAGSVHGMRLLIPIFGLPIIAIILYLFFFTDTPPAKITILSNPIATSIICIILSQIQGRLRYNEFWSEHLVSIQNQRLNQELELARAVQSRLIPVSMPRISGLALSSLYKPMIGIGGDFFDFIPFRESNRIGIFICDVSGHGVSAALIASMFKTLITTSGDNIHSPASLLRFMNEQLIGKTGGHFITAFYCICDIGEKSLFYARAGHHYPILIRNNSLSEIASRGVFLGLMNNITIEEKKIRLERGDKIILYTDGLTESRNSDNIEFEATLFSRILPQSGGAGIEQYLQSIYNGLLEFRKNESFDDDICIVGMEIV